MTTQQPADIIAPAAQLPPADDERRPRPAPGHAVACPRLVRQVIAGQLVCVAVLVGTGYQSHAVLVTAAVAPAILSVSLIAVRSRSVGSWVVIWLSWWRRRRKAAALSGEGDAINPLSLMGHRPSLGTIRGFRHSELGVLHLGHTWVSAVWVTDGPRAADPAAADGLSTLLALPASPAPGTTLCAVLQQSTADLGAGPRPQLVAWLVARVEPLRAMLPAQASTAVPTMIRSEIRRLLRHTTDHVLALVPLDRRDLLNALAASTEVPLTPPTTTPHGVSETWHLWQAQGRYHHAFQLHPGTLRPLPVLVGVAMDVAACHPDAVLTLCVPYPTVSSDRHDRLPVLRLSGPDPGKLMPLAEEIMDALDREGAATRPLTGLHGLALLDTSILAGPACR